MVENNSQAFGKQTGLVTADVSYDRGSPANKPYVQSSATLSNLAIDRYEEEQKIGDVLPVIEVALGQTFESSKDQAKDQESLI